MAERSDKVVGQIESRLNAAVIIWSWYTLADVDAKTFWWRPINNCAVVCDGGKVRRQSICTPWLLYFPHGEGKEGTKWQIGGLNGNTTMHFIWCRESSHDDR